MTYILLAEILHQLIAEAISSQNQVSGLSLASWPGDTSNVYGCHWAFYMAMVHRFLFHCW